MLHIWQLVDCDIETSYDGSGFDELYNGDPDEDEHGHTHIRMVADSVGNVCSFDGSGRDEDFDTPIFSFEALVYPDTVLIQIPHAPTQKWLSRIAGSTFLFLDEHYGIDVYDDDETTQYNTSWREGTPHPLFTPINLLLLLDATQTELTPREAENFGIDTEEEIIALVVEQGEDAIYYFPDYADGVIIAEDRDEFRKNLSGAIIDAMAEEAPYDLIENPYQEAELIETPDLFPWLAKNGEEAAELWNVIAPVLPDEEAVIGDRLSESELDFTDLKQLRLLSELLSTIDHENYAHPEINAEDQFMKMQIHEDINTPDNADHPWVSDSDGYRFKNAYLDMDAIFRTFDDDAFDYDEGIIEEGALIDLHSADLPALITYRVGEYGLLFTDEEDEHLGNPKGHMLKPVAIRRCGHDEEIEDEVLERYFEDFEQTPFEKWMLEDGEKVPESVLDESAVNRDEQD